MEQNKPRRIRDIAHIYLSQLERRSADPPRRLVVSADGRECLPGFHVANIALALSQRGFAVRVFETSGLHPNSAFFLSLPDEIHVDGPVDPTREWFSAFGGVILTFAPGASAPPPSRAGASTFELVHAPPTGRGPTIAAAPAVAVPAGHEYRLGLTASGPERALEYRFLDAAGQSAPPEPDGRIERWEEAVTDPILPLVRDPDSLLSRAYAGMCSRLTARRSTSARMERPDEGTRIIHTRRRGRRRRPGSTASGAG